MSTSRSTKSPMHVHGGCDHDDEPARPGVHARVDVQRIENAVREILFSIGEDPDREGLLKTPNRAACVIEASHTCMTIRGAKKGGSTMVTSALRGIFKENAASRSEVLALMYGTEGTRR